MSKRKRNSNRTISHEEARQALIEGRFDVAGVIRMDPKAVSGLLDDFESLRYLLLSDLVQVLSVIERKAIDNTEALGSAYVSAFPFEVVKTIALSLLRVPAAQRELGEDRDDSVKTEEEMKKLSQSVRDAARISRDVDALVQAKGALPSLEELSKRINATEHGPLVRELLENAREGDPPITMNNNEELPPILPMPKCFQSKDRHEVELEVDCYHEGSKTADVKIVNALGTGDTSVALDGLINVILPAKFVDRKSKIRRALLASQMSKKSIAATVEVTRSFRASDTRYNALTLCKVKASSSHAQAVEMEAKQLKLDLAPAD